MGVSELVSRSIKKTRFSGWAAIKISREKQLLVSKFFFHLVTCRLNLTCFVFRRDTWIVYQSFSLVMNRNYQDINH